MRINTDIFAFADDAKLMEIINSDEKLKAFVDMEAQRAAEDNTAGGCSSGCGHNSSGGCGCPHRKSSPQGEGGPCSHGGSGCCNKTGYDPSYLTTALISIFNYYIPDDIKNSINMGSSTFIDE